MEIYELSFQNTFPGTLTVDTITGRYTFEPDFADMDAVKEKTDNCIVCYLPVFGTSIFIFKREFSNTNIKIEQTVRKFPKFSTPFELRCLSNFSVP